MRSVVALLIAFGIVGQSATFAAEPVVNSLGMRLVEIPAGEFVMGSDEPAVQLHEALKLRAEPDVRDEGPAHRVRISRAFYLGAYEVTVGEFRQFADASGYRTEAEINERGGVGRLDERFDRGPQFTWKTWWPEQSERHPVVNVSWNDAAAFCRWLSEKEGKRYRLPTEAEWEYACRAGSTTRFCAGDDAAALAGIGNFADPAAHAPGTVLTSPVGSFAPNEWGLYDMHGNVWEWVADYYLSDYYDASPTDDPPGPERGATRVLRGGCWGFPIESGRSASRGRGLASTCGYRDGFRIVCEK